MYFSAIQKIGEQALQSSTSQILGEVTLSPKPLPTVSALGLSFSWALLFYFCFFILR